MQTTFITFYNLQRKFDKLIRGAKGFAAKRGASPFSVSAKKVLKLGTAVLKISEQGFITKEVNLITKNKESYDRALKLFTNKLTRERVYGSGALAFTGVASDELHLFAGFCPANDTYLIRVQGNKGVDVLRSMRESLSKADLQNFKPTKIAFSYYLKPDRSLVEEDVTTMFVVTARGQKRKSKPKMQVDDNILTVGSKSSPRFAEFSAVIPNKEVSLFEITCKLSGDPADGVWNNTIIEGFNLWESQLALEMLGTLSKITSVDAGYVVTALRNTLNANFEIGNPALRAVSTVPTLKASLKAARAALLAVFNKLTEPVDSADVQTLILDFLEGILNLPENCIYPDKATFINRCQEALTGEIYYSALTQAQTALSLADITYDASKSEKAKAQSANTRAKNKLATLEQSLKDAENDLKTAVASLASQDTQQTKEVIDKRAAEVESQKAAVALQQQLVVGTQTRLDEALKALEAAQQQLNLAQSKANAQKQPDA